MSVQLGPSDMVGQHDSSGHFTIHFSIHNDCLLFGAVMMSIVLI